MSEYQFYEFRAIDRALTPAEQAELRRYSSRAEITSRSFVNEYSYGSFKGDEDEFMARYFDAHLYVANWGSRRLMFRLPRSAVDPEALSAYMAGDHNRVTAAGDFVVVLTLTQCTVPTIMSSEDSTAPIPARQGQCPGRPRRGESESLTGASPTPTSRVMATPRPARRGCTATSASGTT